MIGNIHQLREQRRVVRGSRAQPAIAAPCSEVLLVPMVAQHMEDRPVMTKEE